MRTANGELYMCGLSDEGQLGTGSLDSELVPRRVEAFMGANVVEVSCGYIHTMVLIDTGGVFTWGRGADHRLGLGSTNSELVPRRVEALDGMPVIGIAGGVGHSMAWTTDSLYTWGSGMWGQLGHGGEEHEPLPRVVEAFTGRRIKGVATDGHTLAWLEGGELFAWGLGYRGRLGHGKVQEGESPNVLVPRVVQALAGQKVVHATAGEHSIVSTASGEVYTMGVESDGVDDIWTPQAVQPEDLEIDN